MEDGNVTSLQFGTSLRKGRSRDFPDTEEDLPIEVMQLIQKKRGDMDSARRTIQLFEGKHVMSMILYIDRESPVIKTDIYNNVSRCSSMGEKVRQLEQWGLIRIYYTAYTNSNVVVITEKGRKVASAIRQILDIIDNG